jgi:chromate transport protein ChrA
MASAADGNVEVQSDASYDMGSLLSELKVAVKELVLEIINFIKSNETYKNIATAILAVLAILFLPLVLGVVVIVFVAIVAMETFVGAMVKIVEIILAVIPSLI